VQPAKDALDAAVRARQSARMSLSQDKPLDSANRPTKMQGPARDSPSKGAAATDAAAPNCTASKLKTPGFISARAEASFAATASLASDRSVQLGPSGTAALTRRRLVEPVDSRNPRVGRGMAKIYNGELHAIRSMLATASACAIGSSHFSLAISPFKEVEAGDQDDSPKPRQKHLKSKTLGFNVPTDVDAEQRVVFSVRDGKPTAVQALSLREASDRRGVTVHVPKDVVNSTQKESANTAALEIAARAAKDQASTLVKLGL
jgi:hypothetical protein